MQGIIALSTLIVIYTMQLTLPDDILSTRWVHSVTAISLAPGLTEVTMFGGSNSPHHLVYEREAQSTCKAATVVITFGELNPCPHAFQGDKWMIHYLSDTPDLHRRNWHVRL